MREIKFRAWIDNKMFYINDELYISFFNAEDAVDWSIYNRFDEGCFYKHDLSYPEIYQNNWLMQYTRLKDKNGKEIYEGDIINDQDLIFEIVFQDGCFCKKNEVGVWILYENKFEIIGNIHEKPELLKQTK